MEFPIINDNIVYEEAIFVVVSHENVHISLVRYRASWFWETFFGSWEQWYEPKYIVKPYSAFRPTELKDGSPWLKAYQAVGTYSKRKFGYIWNSLPQVTKMYQNTIIQSFTFILNHCIVLYRCRLYEMCKMLTQLLKCDCDSQQMSSHHL